MPGETGRAAAALEGVRDISNLDDLEEPCGGDAGTC
jgi:hypothetical protein